MRLRVRAPAKINWTLEVLGKRPDGYHEVRTILQTIDLADIVMLAPAEEITLALEGDAPSLAGLPPEENLAYRAAQLLRERAHCQRGAYIVIDKHIPVAAGLGGGSSDAAAVLRGLRQLWELNISDDELGSIAAELGSDVPFFLQAGTAVASGRGVALDPIPMTLDQHLVIVWPRSQLKEGKTARAYAALRPEHYTDGSRTERLAARLRAGEPIRDEDLFNVFEFVLPDIDPEAAKLFELSSSLGLGRPHLCGSGPAFFILVDSSKDEVALFRAMETLPLPFRASLAQTLSPFDSLKEWY